MKLWPDEIDLDEKRAEPPRVVTSAVAAWALLMVVAAICMAIYATTHTPRESTPVPISRSP